MDGDPGGDERRRIFTPALLVWLFIVGLFGAGLVMCARAQSPTVEVNCQELAGFASTMAVYRDVDANLEKVLALFRHENMLNDLDAVKVFEREARRVWAEKHGRREAREFAFMRCLEHLGLYPRSRNG